MKKLNLNKYLLRIAGVNILMLVFGMIFGKYLPLYVNIVIVAGFALLWFIVYDENTYNIRYNGSKGGDRL